MATIILIFWPHTLRHISLFIRIFYFYSSKDLVGNQRNEFHIKFWFRKASIKKYYSHVFMETLVMTADTNCSSIPSASKLEAGLHDIIHQPKLKCTPSMGLNPSQGWYKNDSAIGILNCTSSYFCTAFIYS